MNLRISASVLVNVFVLVLVFYGNGLAGAFANDNYQATKHPPLSDVVHDRLPYLEGFDNYANTILLFTIAFAAIMTAVQRSAVFPDELNRYLSVAVYVFFFRAICIVATVLPPAYPNAESKCMNATVDKYEIFARPTMMMVEILQRSNPHVICGDNIFSGHCSAMLILSEYIGRRFKSKWASKLVEKLLIVLTTAVVASLLLSRMHYVVDVVVAIIVTKSILMLENRRAKID